MLDMYGHWKTMSLPLAPINFDNTSYDHVNKVGQV